MKKLSRILTLSFMLAAIAVGAQEIPKVQQEKKHLFYGGVHFQMANYGQTGFDLFYLSPAGHGIHYSYSWYVAIRKPKPSDFPACGNGGIGWDILMREDDALIHELRYQYLLHQPFHRIRFLAEAGISYGNYSFLEYQLNDAPRCYKDSRVERTRVGFSFRVTADFPVFRGTGLQLSFNSNFNTLRNIYGPELTWTLGRVRAKI